MNQKNSISVISQQTSIHDNHSINQETCKTVRRLRKQLHSNYNPPNRISTEALGALCRESNDRVCNISFLNSFHFRVVSSLDKTAQVYPHSF